MPACKWEGSHHLLPLLGELMIVASSSLAEVAPALIEGEGPSMQECQKGWGILDVNL